MRNGLVLIRSWSRPSTSAGEPTFVSAPLLDLQSWPRGTSSWRYVIMRRSLAVSLASVMGPPVWTRYGHSTIRLHCRHLRSPHAW
jgi:hypothetical protein